MATTLLKTGLRSIISRSILEKRATSILTGTLVQSEQEYSQPQHRFQYNAISRRMYGKRNVHHGFSMPVNKWDENDSDSDNEQERGESQFWRRKMRTLHSHLDVNKDGVISYDDFMLLEERFSKLGHLSPKAKTEFREVLNEMWEEQWGEISPYNLICVEKYLEEMHRVLNDSSLKRKCHNFLPFLFKAVDNDHNGEITMKEFELFFKCLDLSHDHAVITFSHIDCNDDGKITLEEFVSLGRDFFLTEDQTKPSKHFWGPLVD